MSKDNQPTPAMTKDLRERIEIWWWNCNGTGTSSCSECRQQNLCTWHSARLDDLLALIQEEMEAVIGEDKSYSLDSARGYKTRVITENDLRAKQRQRLNQLLAPQTNNERKE